MERIYFKAIDTRTGEVKTGSSSARIETLKKSLEDDGLIIFAYWYEMED